MARRKDKLSIKKRLVRVRGTDKRVWRFFWHLRSSYNGEIMCSGQSRGFSREQHAIEGMEAVRRSFADGVEIVHE